MKKILDNILTATLVFWIVSVNAQSEKLTVGGLYLTSSDFQAQKLSFQIDCNNSSDKIRTREVLGSSSGYILANGQKHVFDKNKVYGYRNCKNKSYRFYKNEAYELIDTVGFYIYYHYRSATVNQGKGLVKMDEYFFSDHPDTEIKLLTIGNLKNAFPTRQDFHYALDSHFRSDKELIAYDSFNKEYKIKHLFNLYSK
jgi:hypothetical protein